MYIKQLYTKCLSEAAYYIESDGEAAIIDPLRETFVYEKLAESRGAKIKYVFETHFHADFVSGHIDLARKSGAKIIYGPTAKASYDIYEAKDEEVFLLGKISIVLLHTPGHTLESSCYLLKDEKGDDHAVFTGDTLFVGDVGRPDLAVDSGTLTQEDLAGMLYDSLQTKLIPLDDKVIVYPGHGAGSACGKNLGSETTSTIGEQKANNYALKCTSKKELIKELTDGLSAPPAYFFKDAMMNKEGYVSIDEVLQNNTIPLNVLQIKKAIGRGVLLLDVRDPNVFAKGYIPGSINISLKGQYAPWVGALIDSAKTLALITEKGQEEEAILRLARVGYEDVLGYLEGGIDVWDEKLDIINNVSSSKGALIIKSKQKVILDVRKLVEFQAGHVAGAVHIPLKDLPSQLNRLNSEDEIIIYCAGGYRSMIASSILKLNGFANITNIIGGYQSLQLENIFNQK